MFEPIIDSAIKLFGVALLGFGSLFIKKGIDYVSDKIKIQLSESTEAYIDSVIEQAVRATEEQARTLLLDSENKEQLALAKVKAVIGDSISESVLLDKIKSVVNYLYNSGRSK